METRHLYKLVIFGLVYVWMAPAVAVVKFSTGFRSITTFPNDEIPDDVEEIHVFATLIKVVDYIKPLSSLKSFNMYGNTLLSRVPDLSNVSANLYVLKLQNNSISEIGHLPPMPNLRQLTLNKNPLARFPDLSNVTLNLKMFDISDTDIVAVPDQFLHQIKGLAAFRFGRNNSSPVRLPNVCSMGHAQITVYLVSDRVECDGTAAFAKSAEKSNKLKLEPQSGPLRCSSPPALDGELYTSVTVEMMQTQETSIQQLFVRSTHTSGEWACPPDGAVESTMTLSECSLFCQRDKTCLMFATDKGKCVMANFGGTSSSIDVFWTYPKTKGMEEEEYGEALNSFFE